MSRVRFDDGIVINFDGDPTQQDIEEAYSQVKSSNQPSITQPRKDLIDKLAGITPKEMAEQGNWVASGLQQTAKDVFTIPANFLNQLLLNAPRSLGNTLNAPLPTEAQSGVAQGLNKIAGVAGGLMSPVTRIGAGLIKAPITLMNLAKMAGAGAIGGAAYSPTENFMDLGQRGQQAAIGGVTGAALPLVAKGGQKLIQGIKEIKNIPDNFFRGGLTKTEALRMEVEYGASNGSLVEQVKNKVGNFITEAGNKYKEAVINFKGNTIKSDEFYNTLQRGLREKGWIDLQGMPTNRYQSGLDPVVDKLTNLYVDLQNIASNKGEKVIGQIMSKEDFSTYRDALGAMLREKPSDRLVMQARNSLYNSAEKSGMTGIKAARDLEKRAYGIEKRFLDNKGDLKIATEAKLNRIGTDKPLSKQELLHIQELQQYIKHPIIQDATKINKLNQAKDLLLKRKQLLKGAAVGSGLTLLGIKGAKKFTE